MTANNIKRPSVGRVCYRTGDIILNDELIFNTSSIEPTVKFSYKGKNSVSVKIKDKGSNGNKYGLNLSASTPDEKGNIIYTLGLMINGVDIPDEKIIASSDPLSDNYLLNIENDILEVDVSNTADESVDIKSIAPGSYEFSGGIDGTLGIKPEHYIGASINGVDSGAHLFNDTRYPAQLWPSLGYADMRYYQAMKDIAWERKDTTCVFDCPYMYGLKRAIQWRNGEGDFKSNSDGIAIDSWWCEMYYDWTLDEFNDVEVVLPPSYHVVKNSLASFRRNGTWYPVAGKERGTLDCIGVTQQVKALSDRDMLITNNINPIYDTGNQGIQIYGNETMNVAWTDLSAAHIGRTLTYIRSKVDAFTETLKFELNDVYLWRRWIDFVEQQVLEPIKANRGLKWYNVNMGLETTSLEELAQRRVNGVIELQFTPDAEIFNLSYVVYSSSLDMGE